MKREIALRWAKALRSGKYRQTRARLKNEEGFCCLGVLCSISKKGRWVQSGSEQYRYRPTGLPEEANGTEIPETIQEWAGMKSGGGSITLPELGATSLAELNDTRRYSFKQIAEVIERYSEKL